MDFDVEEHISNLLGRVIQGMNKQPNPFELLAKFKAYATDLYTRANA